MQLQFQKNCLMNFKQSNLQIIILLMKHQSNIRLQAIIQDLFNIKSLLLGKNLTLFNSIFRKIINCCKDYYIIYFENIKQTTAIINHKITYISHSCYSKISNSLRFKIAYFTQFFCQQYSYNLQITSTPIPFNTRQNMHYKDQNQIVRYYTNLIIRNIILKQYLIKSYNQYFNHNLLLLTLILK
ncbi:hypothetical protein TTHERM_000660449 (macronuclear) [Tetrahymena thermophila SB210]|uniref:Uncharacterized protein n=1 Tax=Tetrahymena thermophila (strain SB210) TaxID=312017 RepID=W7X2F6_TETTS|nr:hypothetical protein TTHERM_000660449 [Tetrahymena thermophila SB210]EWS73410.1 hypothetical protein TTHERM_000660449 [Tetrahymena thermophila SB210]|eukprot:XP_012654062.1 hypothetical protein TTHERM_000660449 [Tetrahymena thermophila SB210]